MMRHFVCSQDGYFSGARPLCYICKKKQQPTHDGALSLFYRRCLYIFDGAKLIKVESFRYSARGLAVEASRGVVMFPTHVLD